MYHIHMNKLYLLLDFLIILILINLSMCSKGAQTETMEDSHLMGDGKVGESSSQLISWAVSTCGWPGMGSQKAMPCLP